MSTRWLMEMGRARRCSMRLERRRLLWWASATPVSGLQLCPVVSRLSPPNVNLCQPRPAGLDLGDRRLALPCGIALSAVAMETSFEYGSRVGIWRLLDLFEKHDIRVTMYAVGLALEQNPPATQAMLEGGHEIASHCWRWFN